MRYSIYVFFGNTFHICLEEDKVITQEKRTQEYIEDPKDSDTQYRK